MQLQNGRLLSSQLLIHHNLNLNLLNKSVKRSIWLWYHFYVVILRNPSLKTIKGAKYVFFSRSSNCDRGLIVIIEKLFSKLKQTKTQHNYFLNFQESHVSNVYRDTLKLIMTKTILGAAHGVMVIVVGNGHGGTSSNPGRD